MAMPLPANDLAPIVVEAPRLPSLAGEAVFSATQIDARELSIAPRLDAALKSVPGVSLFRRTGSDGANPTIQGISLRGIAPSGAGRALVTLDGVPINDPFGGWVIWSAVPTEGLAGATIVRGAGAGMYGAGALTGVVALTSAGSGRGQDVMTASIGSLGAKRLAGRFGEQELTLVAGMESGGGYRPVRGPSAGAADVATKLSTSNVSAQMQRAWGDLRGSIHLGGYQERRGSGLLGARSVAQGADASITLADIEDTGGWRLQAWARSTDLFNSSVAVATNRATVTPASEQYATPALGYGFNAAWQVRTGIWSWELGGDARLSTGRAYEHFRYQNGTYTRGRESGGRTAITGIYVDASRSSGPLLMTGGVRLDQWSQSGAVRIERDVSTGLITLNNPAKGASGVTPTGRLGARLTVSDHVWLRAAAYAGFRPPTLNELHRPFRVGNDVTEANPALSPETLYGGEFGLGGNTGLDWTVSAFYNEIKDPVTNVTLGVGPKTFPIAGFIPAGGALRMRENGGTIEASGLEAEAHKTLGPLRLDLAGSYTHARVDGGSVVPQLTGKRPAQAPRVSVTAGLGWDATAYLTLSANGRYESDRFEDDLNTRVLPASTELNARAEWRYNENVSVFFAVENFNNSNIVVGQTGDGVSSYAAPRAFRIGLIVR
ncbi:MAG: TonB-dependent receptor [Alphaproteobacteria bacterium]